MKILKILFVCCLLSFAYSNADAQGNNGHGEGSAWAFAGTHLAPLPDKRGKPPLDRAQLIDKVFGGCTAPAESGK